MLHRLSLTALLAWVGLGSDGLSSVVYGPEEAFLDLGSFPFLGVLVAFATAITIWVIATSYSQVVELFPSGAGGYAVASKLLSPTIGMVSGSALLIDYVLTITISIASGTEAILSFLDPQWHSYKLVFALVGVLALMAINLRGVREAVLPLVPLFLAFLITHLIGVGLAFASNAEGITQLPENVQGDWSRARDQVGLLGVVLLVSHAFGAGAGTFTGIEAVSNGILSLREPRVETAKRTLRLVALSLSGFAVGLMLSYLLFPLSPVPGKTLNAILFETVTSGWPANVGRSFVISALVAEALLLLVAAQTGFVGGPRVLSSMAADHFWPTKYATLSDRLVAAKGVLVMGLTACLAMVITGASVKALVILYSISVFITFVLTQLGMLRYWLVGYQKEHPWLPPQRSLRRILVPGIGLVLTAAILVLVVATKFSRGGWMILLALAILVTVSTIIHRRYQAIHKLLSRVDIKTIEATVPPRPTPAAAKVAPAGRTAVLLVTGYNPIGLQLFRNFSRDLGDQYHRLVFMGVGVLDAGSFKGAESVTYLERHVRTGLEKYVELAKKLGYAAESVVALGVDVIEEVEKRVPSLRQRYGEPRFIIGSLELRRPVSLDRFLHNNTADLLRKRLKKLDASFQVLAVHPPRPKKAGPA